MARRVALLALLVTFVLAVATPPLAAHSSDDDVRIHRTRQYHARNYARWALGESPSPLLASLEGDCGDVVERRFYIAPPIEQELELRCRVRHGLPIVFSHAGWFTSIPADGSTDAEIIAAANAGFATIVESWVRFDGERVGVRGKTFNLGAFTIRSAEGSFYDVIGIGTGRIRTSLTGTFLTIKGLDCGRYVLKSAVEFDAPGEVFSATHRIRVVGCHDDD
jgi:hypothetical protein